MLATAWCSSSLVSIFACLACRRISSAEARELYTETVLPKVLEGRGEAGPRAPDYTRMIEVKVSFDTDMKRALEDTRHWAVLALTPEEKISVHSPEEMERLAGA